MNTPQRKLFVNLTILRVLDGCDGMLVPEDALFVQAGLSIRPLLLKSEFDLALANLQELHLIVGVNDSLGGPVKWKLTELGVAKLSERG